MTAQRKQIIPQSSTGSYKSILAGWLAFCSILALSFSVSGFAEELSNTKNDINQEEAKAFINLVATRTANSSNTAVWQYNTSVITQIGNDNQARVEQQRNESLAYGNYSNIYQNGNRNEANIIQSGGNNTGLIGQIGNDHQATIEQAGNRFKAHINQHGLQSNINLSQSGSGLRSISVSQSANSGAAAPITIRTN